MANLSNVLPCRSILDHGDHRRTHAIRLGQFSLVDTPSALFAYLKDILCNKNNTFGVGAVKSRMPTFLNHIYAVIAESAQKKVCRLYALWIIASVADQHSGWYFAIAHFVNNTSGKQKLTLPTNLHINGGPRAVVKRTFPFPAVTSNLYFRQNTLKQWSWGHIGFSHNGGLT